MTRYERAAKQPGSALAAGWGKSRDVHPVGCINPVCRITNRVYRCAGSHQAGRVAHDMTGVSGASALASLDCRVVV